MSTKEIEGYFIYMGKILGRGSYGSVYLGRSQTTSESVAVKILSKDSIDRDEYLKAALKNEIEILQKLHSDNIVELQDVLESSKNYYLVTELCDGDLEKEIAQGKMTGQERNELQAIQMLKQLCNGFLTLVREGVIHRDLKPANIMRQGDRLKLGDFGFARQMGTSKTINSCVGTPLYMSLQVLRGEEYSSKCDVWALGVVFYEILHGDTPWTANNAAQLIKNIEKIPLTLPRKDLSPQTQDFLRKCLQLREPNRISWDQIFAHPIFNNYFLSRSDTRIFQNKMKGIMNKLRFYIQQKNLDLKKIMDSLGFGADKQEITYHDFYLFWRKVYPEVTHQQADYVFKRTDTDHSGTISVDELKGILVESGIKLASQFEIVPSFMRMGDGRETFTRISQETSLKIQNCFQKLYGIINKNGLTLQRVFGEFDQKQGSLSLSQFALLVRKLCPDISQQEIAAGFQLIDQDGSDSIQFEELDKYYSKINGVPQAAARRKGELRRTFTEGTLQFKPRESMRRRTKPEDANGSAPRFIQQYTRPPPYIQPAQDNNNCLTQQYRAHTQTSLTSPRAATSPYTSPGNSPVVTPFSPFSILRKRL